jgi:hypothetical protein
MRANAPEWVPGRRDTLETLKSDIVLSFPASRRRNVGALPRNVSSHQTGLWDDARRSGRNSISRVRRAAAIIGMRRRRPVVNADH